MENNFDYHITPRSRLFNIEPIGLGTPYAESLTSYISRLANLHCLTTGNFISKLLAPYLNKYYVTEIAWRGGNGFFDSTMGINGIGDLAIDFINVIKYLNFREDLNKTTLIYWKNIIPTRGLMKKQKAWCTMCFQEDKLNGEPIYDRLLWFIKEVHCCPKHRVNLRTACPKCNKTMQIIGRNTVPGYCQYCHIWLGDENFDAEFVNEENIKAAQLIGEMLTYSSSNDKLVIEKEWISFSLNKIIDTFFDGTISTMFKILDFPQSTLRYWVNGQNLPPLSCLIRICLKLNITILEFLEVNKLPSLIELPVEKIILQYKSRQRFDHNKIKSILQEEINSECPNSLKKISEKIGCDRKLLYKKYPVESKLIVDNYSRYCKEQKNQRLVDIEKELTDVFNQLIEQQVYPSRRQVEEMMGNKYFVKEKAIQEQWNFKKNKIFKY